MATTAISIAQNLIKFVVFIVLDFRLNNFLCLYNKYTSIIFYPDKIIIFGKKNHIYPPSNKMIHETKNHF